MARSRSRPCSPIQMVGKRRRIKHWLGRWRAKHRISFRECKRKSKASKDKLQRRTRTPWLKRWAAIFLYSSLFKQDREKNDLPAGPYKICRDQKGILLNQSESVKALTMNFERCEDGIKINHGQPRTRVSLLTSMTADPDPDNSRPLQICYKPSGSYNYEATMRYLEQHVPVRTEEREEKRDLRVRYLDDFAVHKTEEDTEFLRSRGFSPLLIGGGCTSIICSPDTDCHGTFRTRAKTMEDS